MQDWNRIRNEYQLAIWNAAELLPGLRIPELKCDECEYRPTCDCVHAAYKCYVFVELDELKDAWTRDRIISEINDRGVPCFSGSCSEIYLEKAFEGAGCRPRQRLANARELGETSMMFLVHPT